MATSNDDFKFPDEVENVSVEVENTEIEIVDDTPAEDRNRRPMEEPPSDLTDDELNKYDESVKHRIKHFSKGYHEERRAKEAALREREEAINFANSIIEENKKLKGSLTEGQRLIVDQAKQGLAQELDNAKRAYKQAYESGDADALLLAQEQLTNVKIRADKIENFKPTPLQEPRNAVQIQQPQIQQVDPRAEAWREKNSWWGKDRRMTSYALGLHEELTVEERINPSSDEYWQRIDAEMRERFPDKFESEKRQDATPSAKKSNVAPATRSTAAKKIVLTQTQVQIAKKLGVPLELYAKQVAAEQRRGS